MSVLDFGFHVADGRQARLERWQEQKEERAFEALVAQLRRRLLDRGVCRFCTREVGQVAGADGSVLRFHLNNGTRCAGSGRAAAPEERKI